MWIVKLGGSLIEAPELGDWLLAAAKARRPVLLVPGGGPFADSIRGLQTCLGCSNATAHRMALLAMQQYGLLLHDRVPDLPLVETPDDIAGLAGKAGGGIWLPWAMFGRDPSIPATWEATSDSMALLLAIRVGAQGLLLVKSASLPQGSRAAGALADAGILDGAFPGLLEGFPGPVLLAGRQAHERLAPLLDEEEEALPGVCRVLA